MSVTGADILEYPSTASGSTGGGISGSTITSGVINNVWADITDSERIAGVIKYRKTFFKNTNAVDSMILPVIYTPVLPTNATIAIGLGVDSADDADATQGNMSAFSAPAQVALTDNAGAGRVVTIYGLNNAGTPVPTTETVVMTGGTDDLSVNTYSVVYAIFVNTTAVQTILVKQGAAGTLRGTVNSLKKGCWLWLTSVSTKGAGLRLPNLAALQSYGVWRKLTVAAGAGAVRPNTLTVRAEENA